MRFQHTPGSSKIHDWNFEVLFPVAASDFFRVAKDVIPTLRGIKHTTNSIRNMADMLAEFGDRFQVLCGLDEVRKNKAFNL